MTPFSRKRVTWKGCVLLAAVAMTVNARAAQEPQIETRQVPGERMPSDVPPEPQSETGGLHLGSFRIHPGLLVTGYYDDNLFVTDTNPVDDLVTVVSPSVLVHSDWDKHFLNLDAGADIARYANHDTEDHEHYHVSSEGRFDFSNTANAFGGVRYYHDTEDRESPDAVFGATPTQYDDIGSYGGVFGQFDRFAVRLGGTFQQLNFDNVQSLLGGGIPLGTINNHDRNRDLYTGGANISYYIAPGRVVFVQAAGDFRRYADAVDDFGFKRDSDGYRLLVGTNLSWGGLLDAELYVGYMQQYYNDPTFKNFGAPTFGATIDWYTSPSTTVSLYADRTLEETTAFGSSGYLNSVGGVQIQHEFTRNLSGSVRAAYTASEFQNIDRTDYFIFVGASLRYLLNQYAYLQTDYQHRNLDTNIPTQDFERNQFFLRLGLNY